MNQFTNSALENTLRQATTGHVVEGFGEVHFGVALRNEGRVQGIFLVAEQLVRDEAAEKRVHN